jgi:hypothetical protein
MKFFEKKYRKGNRISGKLKYPGRFKVISSRYLFSMGCMINRFRIRE